MYNEITASSIKINCIFLLCVLPHYEGADVDAAFATYCTCGVKMIGDLLSYIWPIAVVTDC